MVAELPELPFAINASEIGNAILGALPPQILDSVPFLITLLKIVGIAILAYILFLIISVLFRIKESFRMKKILKNVEEINRKLDLIVKKKSGTRKKIEK